MSERDLSQTIDWDAIDFGQVEKEDALRPMLAKENDDDDGKSGSGDNSPIKGRVINVRFLSPAETSAPEDGEADEDEKTTLPSIQNSLFKPRSRARSWLPGAQRPAT